jgi:hypothetical protein
MVFREVAKVLRIDAKSRLKRRIKSPKDARLVIETVKEEIEERKREAEIMKKNVRVVEGHITKLQLVTPKGVVAASVSFKNLGSGVWEGQDLYVGSYYFNKARYRGLGLAKVLLSALEDHIMREDAKIILFNAKPGLVAFYEKLGAIKDARRSEIAVTGWIPMKFILGSSKRIKEGE